MTLTPLDLLREASDPEDVLHSAIPTDRNGDDLTVLTLREQPANDGDGTVLHLRFAVVDLDERSVSWTSNGIVMDRTANLPVALLKSFAAVDGRSETDASDLEPLLKNGLDGGDDSLAERLLERDLEPSDVDHSKESVEETGPTVTCEKCGLEGSREDMVNFGGGVVDAWVHEGDCPESIEEVDDR